MNHELHAKSRIEIIENLNICSIKFNIHADVHFYKEASMKKKQHILNILILRGSS